MASNIYGCIGLSGGSPGDVDTLVDANLNSGDMAIAIVGGATDTVYIYTYDTGVGGDTSSPDLIKCSGAGALGRMVLCRMHANDLTTTDDVTVGDDLIVTGLCTIGETLAVTGAVTAASLELGGSGAVPTEFSTDGTLGGNSDTAIPTEKAVKTYVATVLSGVDYALMKGFIERSEYGYGSATTITLTSGRVHMRGDAQGAGIHWWDSTLTFTAESGGSNGCHIMDP